MVSLLTRLVLVFGWCLPGGAVLGQTVYYVDTDAPGPIHNGTSWAEAYSDLQDALAVVVPPAEIRVAQGTYRPDRGTGDREATFQLISGVVLSGGYAGSGEPDPDARKVHTYETTLNGDLGGDDGPGFINNDENSYHVVTGSGVDADAVIDGFTITAGNANGPLPLDNGGGMYIESGTPTVSDCYFVANVASRGGAIHHFEGGAALIDCYLGGNAAGLWGGAIDNFSAEPTLVNCVLVGNTTAGEGGAIHSDLSTVTLTNCTIARNKASNRGGGVFNYVAVTLVITNGIVWGNSDSTGSGEPAQLFTNPSNKVTVNYSCLQGWTGGFGGVGNIGDDPLFRRPPDPGPDGLWNGVDDDYGNLHLRALSPCVDAGDNNADTDFFAPGIQPLPDHDLGGFPRIANNIVDLGAYELPGPVIPVLSQWGVVAMTLLLLVAGSLVVVRKERTA